MAHAHHTLAEAPRATEPRLSRAAARVRRDLADASPSGRVRVEQTPARTALIVEVEPEPLRPTG